MKAKGNDIELPFPAPTSKPRKRDEAEWIATWKREPVVDRLWKCCVLLKLAGLLTEEQAAPIRERLKAMEWPPG